MQGGERSENDDGRQTAHLKPVLPTVPLKRRCDEFGIHVYVLEPSILLVIGAEHNLVFSIHINANAVIREGLGRVEIEDKE